MPIVFPTYEKLSRLPVPKETLDKWLDWTSDRFDDVLGTRPRNLDPNVYASPGVLPPDPRMTRYPSGIYNPSGIPLQPGSYLPRPRDDRASSRPPYYASATNAPPWSSPHDGRFSASIAEPAPAASGSRDRRSGSLPGRVDRRASAPAPEPFRRPAESVVPPPPKGILKHPQRPSALNPIGRTSMNQSPSLGYGSSPELRPANIHRVHPSNGPSSPAPSQTGPTPSQVPISSSPLRSSARTADLGALPHRPLSTIPGSPLTSTPGTRRPVRYTPSTANANLHPDYFSTPRPNNPGINIVPNLPPRPRAHSASNVPLSPDTTAPVPMPQFSSIDPLFRNRGGAGQRPVQQQAPPELRHNSGATSEEQWRARREAKKAAGGSIAGLGDPVGRRRSSVHFSDSDTAFTSRSGMRDGLHAERDRRDRRSQDGGRRRGSSRGGRRYDGGSSSSETDSDWSSELDRGPGRREPRRRTSTRR